MKSTKSRKLLWLAVLVILIAAVYLVSTLSKQQSRSPRTPPKRTGNEQSLPDLNTTDNSNPDWLAITTTRSFGWPSTQQTYKIREFSQYTVGFDADKKQPGWVAYELLPAEVEGNVGKRPRFLHDPTLPNSASPDDYTNSGYDRGHMAPAADFTYSRDAMIETFYMSNICPQEPDFNRGIWRLIEEQTRRWSLDKGRIWIVTGPVFGKRNKRIGSSKVAVPKAFYKVLFTPDTQPPQMLGFYLENRYYSESLSDIATTVDEIERNCNCDIYSNLPNNLEEELEANLDKSKWF